MTTEATAASRNRAAIFTWTTPQPTHAQAYLSPAVTAWLRDAGARRVMDLGCGNGALTAELSQAGFEMTGIDASASGVAIARQQAPETRFVRAWIEDSLPDALRGAFDTVVAVEVIEHLLVPGVLCARAREALTPGGHLIVTTPYHGYLKNLVLAAGGRFDRHWEPLHDGGHVKFFSKATLSDLFAREGFIVTRFGRVGRIAPLAKSMIMQARVE